MLYVRFTRRIWLKTYWERKRISLYYTERGVLWERDHALTVFDMLKKQHA